MDIANVWPRFGVMIFGVLSIRCKAEPWAGLRPSTAYSSVGVVPQTDAFVAGRTGGFGFAFSEPTAG